MPTLLIPPSTILPPPNPIYSIGNSKRRERKGESKGEAVQNNLRFPEARTSSYCGGHCLSAAPRSEHYSACFNDAQNGGGVGGWRSRLTEKERENRGSRWRWEDWAIFFYQHRSPHLLSYLSSLSSALKVHLSFHIHLKRFF